MLGRGVKTFNITFGRGSRHLNINYVWQRGSRHLNITGTFTLYNLTVKLSIIYNLVIFDEISLTV